MTLAVLRTRIDALFAWLEAQLNLRHTATGCLVIAASALPITLALWVMHSWALLDAAAGQFYQRALLLWAQGLTTAMLLGLLATVFYCLPRFQSREQRPWLAYGLVSFLLVGVGMMGVLYGHKDTPVGLVFLASFALARAWFPMRVLWPGLIAAVLVVALAEWLLRERLLAYAPLLTAPVETGGDLAWWWALWMRVLFDMAVAYFASLLFFVFGIMDRRTRALTILTRLDPLTGLLNRGTFMQQLAEECSRQRRHRRPFCVLMADVDHFKAVNDRYGHPAGDVVLARLGTLLRETVRQVDLPARLGGEEFAVLLPETDLAAAQAVAERVAAQLRAERFKAGDRDFAVSLSIGIARCSDGDAERVLREADALLYRAKAAGRDRVLAAPA